MAMTLKNVSRMSPQSLTILLPFYPTGGMERVEKEGKVPTACTLARLFSNMPWFRV
jgi:hypothetical protein